MLKASTEPLGPPNCLLPLIPLESPFPKCGQDHLVSKEQKAATGMETTCKTCFRKIVTPLLPTHSHSWYLERNQQDDRCL